MKESVCAELGILGLWGLGVHIRVWNLQPDILGFSTSAITDYRMSLLSRLLNGAKNASSLRLSKRVKH